MAKPKTKDLMQALDDSITVIKSKRVDALRRITVWYADLVAFVSVSRTGQTWLDRAEKARILGFGGSTLEEQEAGLLGSIRFYEKGLSEALGDALISFKPYQQKLDEEKAKLEEKAKELRDRFSDVLDLVSGAFEPFNLVFVVDRTEYARSFDENGCVVFSVDHAAHLQELMKKGQLASVVMQEFPIAVRAYALDRDSQGGVSINTTRMYEGMETVSKALHKYLLDAPVTVKKETPPAKRRKRVRPTSYYRKGSIMAKLLAKLKSSSGEITIKDLFHGIDAADPDRFVRVMVRDGDRSGKWTLQKERGGKLIFRVNK